MPMLELWCTFRERMNGLIHRRRLEQDLDDEMAFHLAMKAEKEAAEGMTQKEAVLTARKQFGNPAYIREACRDAWTFAWLESLYADLRQAVRLMIKNPGFTAAAVLSLALGIGANTTMFSVVSTVFTKPLPWNDAGRIVRMSLRQKGDEKFQYLVSPASRQVFEAWRGGSRLFSNIAAVSLAQTGLNLTGKGEAEHCDGSLVSSNFFDLLGVAPAMGRTFFRDEDQAGHANVAVLSDAFWKKKFERDPSIIGQSLMLNGQAYTVVGVMPVGFKTPAWYLQKEAEIWLPLDSSKDLGGRFMAVLGRIRPEVMIQQAETEASAIAGKVEPNLRCSAAPLTADNDDEKPRLMLLFSVVVLVLLVACANVANMLLARSTARMRELGIRASMGAGGLRIARQLIIESAVLAIVAGAIALAVGQSAISFLQYARPAGLPRVNELSLDIRVFVFTMLLSAAAALITGLLPALRVARSKIIDMLGEGSDRGGESRLVLRGRESLIALQVMLSAVLLIGAGLMARSLLALSNTELGFNTKNTLLFNLKTPEQWPADRTRRFYAQVRERIGAIPGVAALGYTDFGSPLEGTGSLELVAGASRTAPGRRILTMDRGVSPGYFRAFGIPMLKGAEFIDQQLVGSNNDVIVNETLAKRHWPGEDALGHVLFVPGNEAHPMRIVGVAKDVKEINRAAMPQQEIYYANQGSPMELLFGVRTTLDPPQLTDAIRKAVAAVDPAIPPYQVRKLEQVVSSDLSPQKFLAGFLSIFAGIAACLAAIGLYGVVSYAASRRTKEIGIRIALGASRWSILRALGGRYLVISGIGLAAGAGGSLFVASLIKHFLYGIEPYDPGTLCGVAVLLILVAGIATCLPARRALLSNPMRALKYE